MLPIRKLFFIGFTFITLHATAQDDLMKMLSESGEKEKKEEVTATFKSTRLINGHSVENNKQGVLQLMILHRFGQINSGGYEFFGLDNATMRLGFDYGVTDWLNVGIGRSTFEKMYDGLLKVKFLKQRKGGTPVTLTAVASMQLNSLKFTDPQRKNYFSSRLTYSYQLLAASKLSNAFSIQLMPTLIHRNLVPTANEKNDVFALGGGGRIKISKSIAFTAEYYYVFPDQISDTYKNSLAVGFDIETGGHVFQIHFTNSRSMVEKGFIAETTGDWLDGGIHFGFNLNRVFTVYYPKE
ncbi:MAG: hypothetical protein JST71_10890 [Bacteroidetes bacterium]|nr:hypothetical protein [Bacteroidota bacterium]MBX7238281.1 hypothetical protein [Bacteroidia bacterium]MCC7513426.1 hypothetical protein [Bacteroidia bacterium]MCW5918376.1 hypothetical protein [Bacteroidota bacterium]HCI58328.1 hypothetical protein [Bacteroidota bacterium]